MAYLTDIFDRIARIFRLLAKFKGLTNLFLAIVQALPTIMNVGTVRFNSISIRSIGRGCDVTTPGSGRLDAWSSDL